MKFQANKQNATEVAANSHITKSGAYQGEILQAYLKESQTGATGVTLTFRTDAGETNDLTIWLQNATREFFGRKIFDALLIVLGISEIETEQGIYLDAKREKASGEIFPALKGQRIGLLVQRRNREYISGGEVKQTFQLDILTPFDCVTRKIASEILSGRPAEALEAKIANTHDIPAKPIQMKPQTAEGYYEPF